MTGIDPNAFDFEKLAEAAREKIEAEEQQNASAMGNATNDVIQAIDLKGAEAISRVSEAGAVASNLLMKQGREVESKINSLKASRVTAELVWNDLPRKMAIGLVVGVGIAEWREASGFEVVRYRDKVVMRLDEGAQIKRYVPVAGALTAGNLWRVQK